MAAETLPGDFVLADKSVVYGRGRPRVLSRCCHCGTVLSARETRKHACPAILERRNRRVVEDALARHLLWARRIARSAARVLPAHLDVRDLEQVAAMALMRCAPGFDRRRGTPFRAYAYRYVYYGCLMSCRRREYAAATAEPLNDGFVGQAKGESVCALPDGLLRELLDGVSAVQSQVIALHYFCHLDLIEVARRIGISHTWAIIQHRRALSALRERLEFRGVRGVEDCL
jgi:RNA polymerase sigma factor (sigma-70 family)